MQQDQLLKFKILIDCCISYYIFHCMSSTNIFKVTSKRKQTQCVKTKVKKLSEMSQKLNICISFEMLHK